MLAPLISSLREALTGVGLSAASDPRDAHPPCALILPRRVSPTNSCRTDVELELLLIAPGPSNGDALAWLDDALDRAYRALPIRPAAQLVAWTSPHTATPLLAWSLTVRKTLTTDRKDTPE